MYSRSPSPTRAAWTPPPQLTSHSGQPLDDRVFFQAPPPEIGRVVSAWSTLGIGETPAPRVSLSTFLTTLPGTLAVFPLIALGAIACFVIALVSSGNAAFCLPIVLLLAVVTVLGGIALIGRVPAECSFVGSLGVARFTWGCLPGPDAVLSFAQAAELHRRTERMPSQRLVERYVWSGADGMIRFQIQIDSGHPVYGVLAREDRAFAAAEQAWRRFQREQRVSASNQQLPAGS
jgi:hypothetical protein